MNSKSNNKVLILKLEENDINGMLLNYDLDDNGKYQYMDDEFIDTVINYLPEYAMGHDNLPISSMQLIPYLREAARSVIKINRIDEIKHNLDEKISYQDWDKELLRIYNSKGIFSELILHFLLREFKNTLPLVSKVYFKDSYSHEAHGFDAVHISPDDKKLWLGETKFYNNGKKGIKELINDLNNHFKHDYLKEQFLIISRAIVRNSPVREEWIRKLTNATRLEEKFDMMIIPLLCIYEDSVAKEFLNMVDDEISANKIYLQHISELQEYFHTNNIFRNKERVQTLLMLLPVESKDRIVTGMLSKLYNLQNI